MAVLTVTYCSGCNTHTIDRDGVFICAGEFYHHLPQLRSHAEERGDAVYETDVETCAECSE